MTIEIEQPVIAAAPCGCMFSRQSTAEDEQSLRWTTAHKEHAEFFERYRYTPQTHDEWLAMISGSLASKKEVLTDPNPLARFYSFPFGYVSIIEGERVPQENIYTDIFKGVGVAKVFLPLEETPVCDSLHADSILVDDILRSLKKSGVDILIFETGGYPDTLCNWMRRHLVEQGFAHLMPNTLPANSLDARIQLNADYPVIVPVANPGKEDINAHGMLDIPGRRLGPQSHRGYALYAPDGSLLHLERAVNPSKEMCAPVLGDQMLLKAQQLQSQRSGNFFGF